MSASLVGSEMCIRDSRTPTQKRLTAALSLTSSCRTCARTQGAYPAAPVSYTHLTLPTICSV
eukprot:4345684-Alexandrium_andersonii.AAC.1